MKNSFCRFSVMSVLLVSVLSMNDTTQTTPQTMNSSTIQSTNRLIDRRIQYLPEEEEQNECPLKDVSVYMTGCWVDAFNIWEINVTKITANGVVQGSCLASTDCSLKFCCSAYQAIKCFSTIGQYFCSQEFSRMSDNFGHMMSRICLNSLPEDICDSVLSLSEAKIKDVAKSERMPSDDIFTNDVPSKSAPAVRLVKESELQKITIHLSFNGSVGVTASVVTLLALLVISALFV